MKIVILAATAVIILTASFRIALAVDPRAATQRTSSTMPSAADQSGWSRWLAGAGPVPELHIPATREAWEKQRGEIRNQLWKLLGDLPPRPQKLDVKTILREDRGDYLLEKFTFDN